MKKINFDIVTEDWQKRLIDEYNILYERLSKLKKALETEGFSTKVGKKQFTLMAKQCEGMKIYFSALEERMFDLELIIND